VLRGAYLSAVTLCDPAARHEIVALPRAGGRAPAAARSIVFEIPPLRGRGRLRLGRLRLELTENLLGVLAQPRRAHRRQASASAEAQR
jgi:hypothetical protein